MRIERTVSSRRMGVTETSRSGVPAICLRSLAAPIARVSNAAIERRPANRQLDAALPPPASGARNGF
jgi:hypothetical protein